MNDLITKLDTLREDRSQWERNTERQRLTATVGHITMTIDARNAELPTWMMEGEREGVVMAWTPARDVQQAIHDACDFARAYVQITLDPHPATL